MAGKGKNEGLSLWYRFMWRVKYMGYHVFGPAQLSGQKDPQWRLRQRREAKVQAAREARLAREGGAGR